MKKSKAPLDSPFYYYPKLSVQHVEDCDAFKQDCKGTRGANVFDCDGYQSPTPLVMCDNIFCQHPPCFSLCPRSILHLQPGK